MKPTIKEPEGPLIPKWPYPESGKGPDDRPIPIFKGPVKPIPGGGDNG